MWEIVTEVSWIIDHQLQISALTTAWGSQQFWYHWSYMPSHAIGQILEKKDIITFKIVNITIPITKCRWQRNCKTAQVFGCGCWWISLLLLNSNFLKIYHEVTSSPYHWRPAVSSALSCSCCLLLEMEESYLETQICKAFEHTSILEPVLQFLK